MSRAISTQEIPMIYWVPKKASLLLHPLVIFSAVWLGVIGLYSLHLSKLLQYSTQEAVTAVLYVWAPFAGITLFCSALRQFTLLGFPRANRVTTLDLSLVDRRLQGFFILWLMATLIEVIVSGGIPIVWALEHGSKIYTDYGIPSLHGLVNSLLLSIALCRYGIFLLAGRRKDLVIPLFVPIWAILIINRNMLLVTLLQYGVLYLYLKRVRLLRVIQCAIAFLLFVLVFGIVGDIRQGSSDALRMVAQPTDQYPEWLPSGALWAYIYATTPINNLIHTAYTVPPEENILFPNTAATLFPSVVRKIIYGSRSDDAESGNLVVSSFNVSTAYIGPYQDYGYIGMVAFSAFTAFFSQLFWFRTNFRDVLIYSILAQCLVITLFFNHFFALPVITQIVWMFCFFLPEVHLGKQARTMLASS